MYIKTIISYVLLTLSLCCVVNVEASGRVAMRVYTSSHPLVYEDLWDMAPYSYLDENGVARGYNIDLVKTICERLNIPYTVRLYHSDEVFKDISTRKADLSIAMYADYHFDEGSFSRSVITLFTQSVAMSKKSGVVVDGLDDLKGKLIYARPTSYAYSELVKRGLKDNTVPKIDLKAALMKINETDSGMVLWNTMALKSIVNRYNLGNIKIQPVNMDHGEYRFLSRDSVLLVRIDSVFQQLEMDDTLTQLRKKWFYPEAEENDIMMYVYYASSIVSLLLLGIFAYYVYFRYRERTMRSLLEKQNERLSLYLASGKVKIFSYDLINRRFHAFHSYDNADYEKDVYDVASFSQYFIEKDFSCMMNAINEIAGSRINTARMTVRLRRTKDDTQVFYFELSMSVLHTIDGQPATIFCTLSNLSDDMKKAEEAKATLLKYRMMFATAVVDMAYCDSEGVLQDINEKMCETFGIKDRQALMDSRFSIVRLLQACNADVFKDEKYWASCIADMDDLKRDDIFDQHVTRKGMIYYDLTIVPIMGDDGHRIGIFITGRDMSESVDFIRRENFRTKRIQMATDRMRRYVENINYALEVGNIRLAHYSPNTRSLDVAYNLNRPSMNMSQLRCVKVIDADYRQQAEAIILNMDRHRQKRFSMRLKTLMVDSVTRHPIYYQVSGVPTKDKDGNVQQYFCLLRNITELVATEKSLHEQTKKAQEAETLKNNFLKNMSYEIRTPLNAVVGFAELFEQEHSEEDEAVFSNEIKSNSKKLLYLVNDILLLSRIDANMIDIAKEPVDIVETFQTRCMMAWSSGLSDKVHTSIECQFDRLVVTADANNVGYVVETLSKLAAQFTDHGNIRTKLDYFNDNLVLKFEDTGKGIDDEKQKHIFDVENRFDGNQNTSGLELVIVYKLVKLMGGNIYVESQVGRGSTFRVTLPCELHEKSKSEGTNTMDFSY